VRQGHEAAFGTTSFNLTSWVAWYGTKKHFSYPTLCFRQTGHGHFVAASYAYSDTMSTFVAECDDATYQRAGIERMSIEQRQAFVEQVFAPELGGEKLLNNNSNFRHLPVIRSKTWHSGNRVLLGDALHSAHPTIGSGTRIAMEDAIALADSVAAQTEHIPLALAAFQKTRQPSKQKLLDATERSYTWYEHFAGKMDALAPVDFVFDFMTRTGRITDARLEAEFPEFLKRYGNQRRAA
jgi:2-polyprenyl-6-methoxyphenol hydroxylase-like FAD-dependent oxidoreductase